jgi:N-acetylglucosamine-6-sulfatase
VQGGAIHFDDRSTLATWLHDAGYRTGFYGKYLNGYRSLRERRGGRYIPPGWDDFRAFDTNDDDTYFDYAIAENDALVPYGSAVDDYSTDVLARRALRFIDAAVASGERFFVLWNPAAPHSPFIPAPRHAQRFLEPDALTPLDAPSFFEADVSDKPAWVRALAPFSPIRVFAVQLLRIRQLQTLQSVDDFVADLMARLREHGVADDTLVAFTSDNGNAWGEHRWASKACIYEECLRVPLLLRYPRLVPLPRDERELAVAVDLAPTLAELAGATLPTGRDGRSLVRVLDATERGPAPILHIESFSAGARLTFVGIRDERWKFAEHLTGERELYDLVADPFELENLASRPEHAKRVQALRARVLARRPDWPDDLD